MTQGRVISDARIGSRYIRMLAGRTPIPVTVTAVDDTHGLITVNGTWQFSTATGGEVDDDLGWDGIQTGSVLIPTGVPLREYPDIPADRADELERWRTDAPT